MVKKVRVGHFVDPLTVRTCLKDDIARRDRIVLLLRLEIGVLANLLWDVDEVECWRWQQLVSIKFFRLLLSLQTLLLLGKLTIQRGVSLVRAHLNPPFKLNLSDFSRDTVGHRHED